MRLSELKLRLKSLIGRPGFDRDVDDEVSFHLSMRERQLRESGSGAGAAREEAHRKFGNTARTAETMREMRGWGALERLWRDACYALRQLRLHPGFALAAILPLALAIGCTAAVLTFADAVLFRPTGVNDPGRIAAVYTFSKTQNRYLSDSYPDFRDIGGLSDFVESAGAYLRSPLSVRLTEGAELRNTELVTGDYFRAAGIVPALGRALTADDDRPGAAPVALASYSLWENRYARSSSILGTVAWLNGVPFTIVGVMPEGYQGMLLDWYADPNFWAPVSQFNRLFAANTAPDYQNRREVQMFMTLARLRPGVSVERFQAALDVLARRVAVKPDYRFVALQAAEARFFPAYRADTLHYLWLLLAVSVVAVVIACFNLANLLLARAAARQQEIAARLALGAGAFRVLQQFVVENTMLALCACALSLPVALAVTPWLRSAPVTRGLVLGLNLSPDWRALGLGVLAGLLTAILAGAVPAWRASRGDLATGLKAARGRRAALRDLFVVAQVACAMTILVPAALMVQNLRDLNRTHLGFDPRGVLLGSLALYGFGGTTHTAADVDRAAEGLLTELRAQAPEAAVASAALPSTMRLPGLDVRVDSGSGAWTQVSVDWVSGGYFELLRTPILSGRSILEKDNRSAQPVAVVNQSSASLLWPGQNPVGRHLRLRNETIDREVVGVAADTRSRPRGISESPQPYLFLPLFQKATPANLQIHVRTPGPPLLFASSLRGIVAKAAPDATLSDVVTLEEQVQSGLKPMTMAAQATGAVSLLGIMLAVAGMFAASAFRIAQQRKEIAIRLAIGAEPRGVIRLFTSRGLWTGIAGAGAGLLPAAWGAGLLRAAVTGAGTPGPWLFALAGIVLVFASAGAAFAAARRIARVHPADVLRVQ